MQFEKPTTEELELLGAGAPHTIPRAVGCAQCRGSGYSGHLGVYELLLMNDELRDLIASNPTITTFRNRCIELGMPNFRTDGLAKVAQGLTTIEEILRL